MVEIRVTPKKMYISSPYDVTIVEFMRSRPNRFWNRNDKVWELPSIDLPALLKFVSSRYEYKVNYEGVTEAQAKDNAEKNAVANGDNFEVAKSAVEYKEIPEWYEFKVKPFDHQIKGISYGLAHPKFLLADEQGLGKALALDTRVYTIDGYKEMRDIQVGDFVFNKQGNPVKVLATYDNQSVNMYRVSFSDGVQIECCEDHLWEIYSYPTKKKSIVDIKWFFRLAFDDIKEIDFTNGGKKHCTYYIDTAQKVKFASKDVPIDPYTLGCIIGNSSLRGGAITVTLKSKDVYDRVNSNLLDGYELVKCDDKDCNNGYRLVKTKAGRDPNEYIDNLRKLGLFDKLTNERFIPDIYKYNSIEVRLAILRGYFDNSGVVQGVNGSTITAYTYSKQLAEDIREVVESLGGLVSFKKRERDFKRVRSEEDRHIVYYYVTPLGKIASELISDGDKKEAFSSKKFNSYRWITKIESIGVADAKCITVDDPDGLYLVEHFVVTHNTKQMLDLSSILKKQEGMKHVLIVTCVNSLKYNWQQEVLKHTNETGYILGTRYKKNGTTFIGSNEDRLADINSIGNNPEIDKNFYIITNIETLRYNKIIKVPMKSKKDGVQKFRKQTKFPIVEALQEQIKAGNISMIIADEIHKIKDSSSLGATALLSLNTEYKVALTGTPIMNKPVDAYIPLHWLDYERHSYYAFEKHYCIKGGYGCHQIVGYRNLPDLQNMLDLCMLRRLKDEVLDLPEKIYINDFVEMTAAQYKLYDDVLNTIMADIDKIKLSPNPLTMLIRLRQVTGNPSLISSKVTANPKFDRMIEIIEDVVENGGKCLVFSNWTNIINPAFDLVQKHGFNPAKYTGENKDVRESEKDRFMTDKSCKVLLGTMSAMGTGLTLTAANTVIFLDDPWNRAVKDQCEDRVHRIGTKESPNIITIMCKGTIDERVNNIVYRKGKLSDIIVDKEEDIISNPKLLNYLLS